MKIGAEINSDGSCNFVVWSPKAKILSLKIIAEEKYFDMQEEEHGYWRSLIDKIAPDAKYFYKIDNELERPDPASNFQPDGVHGASQIVDHNFFEWSDLNWKNIPLKDFIVYEIHIGAFTNNGTFKAAENKLDYLSDLGINAIEVMPVAQFPGNRNWGYDGAYHFAPQNTYGGPEGLKNLVNACHQKNIAVILDVVYNHFGPEGNYASQFAPIFNDRYKTPWGNAINYDDSYSDGVRNYFIENALYWLDKFHIDGLRLDAIHSIYDMSAKHFLSELSERVERFSKEKNKIHHLIAESDLNDVKIIRSRNENGYGIDAQWSDDFHHSIHSLLTSEKEGYYKDFGKLAHLTKAIKESFVYTGNYSEHRKRKYGNAAKDVPGEKFVVSLQNHDQIGNRAFGERLSKLISFEALKLAVGTMFLTPNIPMLFMGEEYGEESPFLYFVSHSDENLINAVRNGRQDEFSSFNWKGEIPDPQSEETFYKSKLNWENLNNEKNKKLFEFYKLLIKLKKDHPLIRSKERENFEIEMIKENLIFIKRSVGENSIIAFLNFGDSEISTEINFPSNQWEKILDSSDIKWNGAGSSSPQKINSGPSKIKINAKSFSLYERKVDE